MSPTKDIFKSPFPDAKFTQRSQKTKRSPQNEELPDPKRANMVICGACKSADIIEGQVVVCSGCNKNFHINCVCMTVEYLNYYIIECEKSWFCASCYQDKNSYDLKSALNEMKDDLLTNFHTLVDEKFNDVAKKMSATVQQQLMTVIEAKEEQMQIQINTAKDRINSLEGRIKQLEQNTSNGRCNCSEKFENIEKKNNVIVTNVPVVLNEKPKEIAIKLANICDVEIGIDDIEAAFRLKSRQNEQAASSLAVQKPPPIIIKFSNLSKKQKLMEGYLQQVRQRNFVTQQKLGYQGTERIFINNEMTTGTKQVFTEAMKLKKEKHIQSVNPQTNNVKIRVNGSWKQIQNTQSLSEAIKGAQKRTPS